MKCYVHMERDAVGQCMTCGKAMCQECSVSLEGRIHCKECLAEGRVITQKPTPRRVSRPVAKQKEPVFAEPKGTPSRVLFQLGEVGGIIGTIVSPMMLMFWIPSFLDYILMPAQSLISFVTLQEVTLPIAPPTVSVSEDYMIVFLSLTLTGLAILFQAIGTYGFYRNYSSSIGLVSAIVGTITALVFIGLFFIPYLIPEVASYLLYLIPTLSVFVTGIIWGVCFFSVKDYTGNNTLTLVTGIFFLLGGFFSVITNILAALVFHHASVPE